MTARMDEFIDTYSKALDDLNAAVFAGAGLSIPAGALDWKSLMRSIAQEIGLDVDREHDLIAVAQYHQNERGGRHRINQVLVDQFAQRAQITENHRILARLPVQTYWTTNYDQIIEEALRAAGKKADVKITADSLAVTQARRDAVVYKVHGDVAQTSEAVVTKDDYEAFSITRRGQLFTTALQGDLVSKTFLFIGYSFNDPNLGYILSRIRLLLESNRREHYCLMRRVHRGDFQKKADFTYAQTKQNLQVKDLQRYGILPVLLDDYASYTDLLKKVELRYRRGRVFISGSAATYSPMSAEDGEEFISFLANGLAKKQFGVISGFGVGVGTYVINGVLEYLETAGTRSLGDRLTLRPVPYQIRDKAKRKARWTSYREEMLSHAGIAVFVFGNKTDASGAVVSAEGLREEFQIAHRMGLFVVPVAATGHVAAELHKEVTNNFDKYFFGHKGLKRLFQGLATSGKPRDVANRVVEFIGKVKETR